MSEKSEDVTPVVLKLMLIGDFIAMFTVFAALLFALHFILVKIKPSLCYHDPIASDFDMYQMAKDVTSKFQKIATKRQPSLQKTVSFHKTAENGYPNFKALPF